MRYNSEYDVLRILSKIQDKNIIARMYDDPCDDICENLNKWVKHA